MIQSFLSRFPDPLYADFFVSEQIGKCFVAFMARQRYKLNVKYDNPLNNFISETICFYDEQESEIATIYLWKANFLYDYHTMEICLNDDDWLIENNLEDGLVSEVQFFDYMASHHKDIANYLLWQI